jgi:four helix bundle protein
VQDYRNLKVWKLAIVLARETYRATCKFPSDERFKLRAQIRSAASSVPANIAEGRARGRDREFAYFLRIALGSASELESHLFLARNLGFIAPDAYRPLAKKVAELKRMLWKLLKAIGAPGSPSRR